MLIGKVETRKNVLDTRRKKQPLLLGEIGAKAGVRVDIFGQKQCMEMAEHFIKDFEHIEVPVNYAGWALKISAGGFEYMPAKALIN